MMDPGFSGSSCALEESQSSQGGEEPLVLLLVGLSVLMIGRERVKGTGDFLMGRIQEAPIVQITVF